MINRSNLIIINLNQSFSTSEIKQKKDENTRWVFFTFILLALLGNLFWFVHINMNINQLIEQRENTIVQLGVDTEKLKQKGRINLSKKDIENLYNVEKNRVTWADKFTEFANITPEDMAITGIVFRNNKFTINAISLINENEKEFAIVENLINTLQSSEIISKDFSSIKFKSSQRKITRGQEILVFVIEAKLNKSG
jgi:Tfp pilus assembly protein PilN|tara:strand:+ start:369 stop:956 length:588 start_codon:yes stop_codon:yes gene_type:complete